jgi:hypothetical protein
LSADDVAMDFADLASLLIAKLKRVSRRTKGEMEVRT